MPGDVQQEPNGPAGDLAFEVTLTEKGYRGVLLHLAARRLRFVPPVLGVAAMFAYGAGMRTEAIGLFGGVVAIPVAVWGYLAWLAGSPTARQLYAPVSYTFSERGIGYTSPEGDGEIGWDGVRRWREAAGHVLLYVSASKYLLVPADDLDEQTRRSLLSWLHERIGPSGRQPGRLR